MNNEPRYSQDSSAIRQSRGAYQSLVSQTRLLVLLLALFLLGCDTPPPVVVVAPEPAAYAWWARTTFHPSGKVFRGHPVLDLNAGWCAIDELRPEIFPITEEVQAHESGVGDARATFSVPFQISGKPAEVVLAVYKTCAGITGTALITLRRTTNGTGTNDAIVNVGNLGTPAQWATVHRVSQDEVDVWWCFECGDISSYRWSPSTSSFQAVPEESEDQPLVKPAPIPQAG